MAARSRARLSPSSNPGVLQRGFAVIKAFAGMMRARIRLPDDVYARARKVCDTREISFAELSRRGLEYILSVYAPAPGAGGEWQPPKPRRLGWKGLTDTQIKAQAQLTAAEVTATRRRKK